MFPVHLIRIMTFSWCSMFGCLLACERNKLMIGFYQLTDSLDFLVIYGLLCILACSENKQFAVMSYELWFPLPGGSDF